MKHTLALLALTLGLTLPLAAAEETAAPPAKKAVRPRDKQAAADFKPTRVLTYKTVGERKLALHVFEPDGFKSTDKRPCFVAIHGGGWVGGTVESFYPFAAHFAKLGYVGVSVEYRLIAKGRGESNGNTVFDCVKDGRSAIRYLRQHAAELGIDPQRIAVSGGSAGGHVAASTALCEGIDEAGDDLKTSSVPNALVLCFPVIDTSTEGYGNAKCGEKWQELSPLHRVKPGLPPTIVFHGTADTVCPFKGAQAFDEAMHKAGNRCELVVHEGGKHGYLMPTPGPQSFADAMRRTEEFLKSLGWTATATK
ncbi:MAG: alpha/beta hydrolase [Verrucomicrobia bacterium]|nr:alpha/beta hydrolase [Verrucomicrobiota bacterium]